MKVGSTAVRDHNHALHSDVAHVLAMNSNAGDIAGGNGVEDTAPEEEKEHS